MLRFGVVLLIALSACARTGLIDDDFDAAARPVPQPETCNGLDDDLDEGVDEDWRDEIGRYVADEHCGGCGRACAPRGPAELEVACGILEETPLCVATLCAEGFAVSSAGRCIPAWERLCLPCATDADCGDIPSARCASLGTETRCSVSCELGCPAGYSCNLEGLCAPTGGSCSCDPGETFDLACALVDPEGLRCPGSSTCDDGVLSVCAAPPEVCDEVDNDCDGLLDEGYRDRRGAYSLDIRNCGECGIDCTVDTVPEGDLICGGDPFAPSCVLDCPDAHDGIDVGDRVDADREIATGCECRVSVVDDIPGPLFTEGEDLDTNCDGADGIVVESFYVATDGDDTGPGSPTRPLRTLAVAMERASTSLAMGEDARPHVFIASGTYTETLALEPGVFVHGGYRRDFRALDPNGFTTVIRAPSDTAAPGGAAVVGDADVGTMPTTLEWVTVLGRDATGPSRPAFGVYLDQPGPSLVINRSEIRAGVAGRGDNGVSGLAGAAPSRDSAEGRPPRGAFEDDGHLCIAGMRNVVQGGRGGDNTCGAASTAGGVGGSPTCPLFASFQPDGQDAPSVGGRVGGAGGAGGQDSNGPIMGISCAEPVCCGLADFSVPTDFRGPQAGSPGADGMDGTAGRGCADAFGRFERELWVADIGTGGTHGTAASGGGGGGAGGGAEMDWVASACEFVDGLGGGGGGGGAGGCGGVAGVPGTSGAPAAAIVIRGTPGARLPSFTELELLPGDGGRGGDGGAGGDGGLGGAGAFGGALPRGVRSTPTLSGPFPGGRGGAGGNGGAGGGGGGGCGGASVGIWLTDVGVSSPPEVAEWRRDNTFRLGRPGLAGRGGGGAAAAADGAEGGAVDVVVR